MYRNILCSFGNLNIYRKVSHPEFGRLNECHRQTNFIIGGKGVFTIIKYLLMKYVMPRELSIPIISMIFTAKLSLT